MKNDVLKKIYSNSIKKHLTGNWTLRKDILSLDSSSELLRGICFNSSGFSASQFEVIAFIQPLYVPRDFIFFTFGRVIKTPDNLQWWSYNENNQDQLGFEVGNLINATEKNFLSKINNAFDFYEYYKKDKDVTAAHFESVAYSACYSNVVEAKRELSELLKFINRKEDVNKEWVKNLYRRTEMLLKVIDFEDEIHKILSVWEMETKLKLKIY